MRKPPYAVHTSDSRQNAISESGGIGSLGQVEVSSEITEAHYDLYNTTKVFPNESG